MDHYERNMHRELSRFCAEHAEYLFPHSPIEVLIEEGKGRMLFFAVWEEGEWYHDCVTIEELEWTVKHLVYMDAPIYWDQQVMRINPTWHKWPQVSLVSIYKLIAEVNSADDAEYNYYTLYC